MNVNVIGQNQMDALNSGAKLSTAKTELQKTSLSMPKEASSEALIKNNRDVFIRTSSKYNSSYDGTDLYDKLDGEIVNVSYINGSKNNKVEIDLTRNQFNALAEMCDEAGIEPSAVLAIMAHESGFNPDASNSAGAKGLMQIIDKYYTYDLNLNKSVYNIAKKYGGDDIDNNPLNPYGNMAAGINVLKLRKDQYGEDEMFKGYAQGSKGSGWSEWAENCDSEFRDIKAQIDDML